MAKKRAPNGEPLRWLLAHKDFDGEHCLFWPFARGNRYGSIRTEQGNEDAHRVMCRLAHGPAPSPKHEAAHRCGNGHFACVNPQHLRWATYQENRQDMIDHGRSTAGERSMHHKLKESDVKTIRTLSSQGMRKTDLAAMYGVHWNTVYRIVARRKWRHI